MRIGRRKPVPSRPSTVHAVQLHARQRSTAPFADLVSPYGFPLMLECFRAAADAGYSSFKTAAGEMDMAAAAGIIATRIEPTMQTIVMTAARLADQETRPT